MKRFAKAILQELNNYIKIKSEEYSHSFKQFINIF